MIILYKNIRPNLNERMHINLIQFCLYSFKIYYESLKYVKKWFNVAIRVTSDESKERYSKNTQKFYQSMSCKPYIQCIPLCT